MTILKLSLASLWNRRTIALLTVFAIGLSVALLLGVEKLRRDARTAFANTISDTDLIVGARSGSVQLLLYSVFRIGSATNNISWQSYQEIAERREVKWAVPLSLGDSHRGFRVLGTTEDYFQYYRYANKRPLAMAEGRKFGGVFEAVLGAKVASDLGYRLGQEITLSHGAGNVSFYEHDDKPFTVVGILAPTSTPVDRTVHVSLEGIEAIHIDWQGGAPIRGARVSAEEALERDLTPKAITAFLLGMKSKIAIFRLQRWINTYKSEPLLAIIPGVALQELWGLLGVAEQALRLVSFAVIVVGLLGMLTVIFAGLEVRRREMAILRSVGARPSQIFALFASEATALTIAGIAFGLIALYALVAVLQPIASSVFGIYLPLSAPSVSDWTLLAIVAVAGSLAGTIPALRAYRLSLGDGLSMRI